MKKMFVLLSVALVGSSVWAGFPGLRIVQLDLARQMETTTFVSNYIDRVSALGYDTLQLYLGGRVGTRSFSLPEGERYTPEQMRGLVAHASERGMTVIPVVSLLGHAEQFFQHPGLEECLEVGGDNVRLGVGRDTFCLSNPKTREFLEKYVGELCEIFPGPHFHAGFDEAWNSGTCPRCREKEAKDELFADCVLFAHDLLARKGKRMWMWDDFFAFHPKAFARMPKDIVMCHWNYDEDISPRGDRVNFCGRLREDALARYAELGYDAIGCCWYRPENIRSFIDYARRNKTFGFLVTQWEELKPFFHGGSYPRVVAAALLMDDPSRPDDVFETACRQVFPSLTSLQAKAVARLLENPADALALACLKGIESRSVSDSQLDETSMLADILLRAKLAQAEATVDRARQILSDPRRTAADVQAAKSLLDPVGGLCRQGEAERAEQFSIWRKGCSPECVTEPFANLAKSAQELTASAAVAKDDEKRLEIQLTLVDYYGIPQWKVFGKFGPEWRLIAKGTWKPLKAVEKAAFVKHATFSADALPTEIRVEHSGFGEAHIRFLSIEDRMSRIVPEKVLEAVGDVRNPEAVLVDDFTQATFGRQGFLEPFYDKTLAEKVSSLTVKMKPDASDAAK